MFQGEVFGLYMIKAYTCIQCLRLFTNLPSGDIDAVHECRPGVMGMFVEATTDCKSFEQYIMRYALEPMDEPADSLQAIDEPENRHVEDEPNIEIEDNHVDNLHIEDNRVIEDNLQIEDNHVDNLHIEDNFHTEENHVDNFHIEDHHVEDEPGMSRVLSRVFSRASSSHSEYLPSKLSEQSVLSYGSNPRPKEGGVYMPPDHTTSQSTLQSMTSGSGPIATIDFRNSGPNPSTGYEYDSDDMIVHSVSSSALLAKGKKRSRSCFSSSSSIIDVEGASSSATLKSSQTDPIANMLSSSAGSVTSSDSYVTCLSYSGKRVHPEQGGPAKKRIRREETNESIEQIEITSSLENLAVDDPPPQESKSRRRRKRQKARAALSKSSNSSEDWLKLNPLRQQALRKSPMKKMDRNADRNAADRNAADRNAFNNNSPGTSCHDTQSEVAVQRLHDASSLDGIQGSGAENRQVVYQPIAASTSRPALTMTLPGVAAACQTSNSLKALSPAKCMQTSSSLIGVGPGPSLGILSPAPNIPSGLEHMRHIVFLDMDNWGGFWTKLPCCLPDRTFVWGFYGGNTQWSEPNCQQFLYAKNLGLWHVHNKCSRRKDAADFAICLMVGKLDERLPKHIPFTILSGDHGFLELENQMRGSRRRATVINPHHRSNIEVYAMICSVGDV
jgi:hypothetical protein